MASENLPNQGYGVLHSHLAIAEEYLAQNGIPKNEANLIKTINRLAKEKEESYTPNPILGKNPESRVSKNLRKVMAQPIYAADGYLSKRIKNKTELQAARIEMGGSVNQLSQMILKHIYRFKTTRKPNADVSNPKEITDFEYVGSGPGNSFTKEQREIYNKHVDVNRHIRILVESYLFWAITPLLSETKEGMYNIMKDMGYVGLDPKVLRKSGNTKELIFLFNKVFGVLFGQIRLKDFLKGYRWTPKGKLIKGRPPKK